MNDPSRHDRPFRTDASGSRGKGRSALAAVLEDMLSLDFAGRILPFDSAAAVSFAEIVANRRRAGKPISQADAEIAAIANSRGASLATRNVADFQVCGIDVINPWIAAP